jgi:hypothetical protein
VAELVGISQVYLLKLVQSGQQHFFSKAHGSVTPDIDQSVAGKVVMMYREVTRKWQSW